MRESNKEIKTMETNKIRLEMAMETETMIINVRFNTNLTPHHRMLKLI